MTDPVTGECHWQELVPYLGQGIARFLLAVDALIFTQILCQVRQGFSRHVRLPHLSACLPGVG